MIRTLLVIAATALGMLFPSGHPGQGTSATWCDASATHIGRYAPGYVVEDLSESAGIQRLVFDDGPIVVTRYGDVLATCGRVNACLTEDASTSLPCLWDADKRGNGQGFSFVVNANGQTYYF